MSCSADAALSVDYVTQPLKIASAHLPISVRECGWLDALPRLAVALDSGAVGFDETGVEQDTCPTARLLWLSIGSKS